MNLDAQRLFSLVLALLPSGYQKQSLRALMALLLQGEGIARAGHSEHKSGSALSRFLKVYGWNTRSLIGVVRKRVLAYLEQRCASRRGAKPRLLVLVDLTSIEKVGKFWDLPLHYLDGKQGLHLVVVYLLVDGLRIPWSLRIWRGKGSPTLSQLALRMLVGIPQWLHKRYKVLILADGGFGDETFIQGLHRLGFHTIVGIRNDRRLASGGNVQQLRRKGSKVVLRGLNFPVWVSWFKLPKPDGTLETRYLIATFPASGATILKWGKRRWIIEAFFKTCKSRLSLNCFGQRTPRGAYRFILAVFLAFLLTHWQVIGLNLADLPQWKQAAQHLSRLLFPDLHLRKIHLDFELLSPFLSPLPQLL